jgi:hypothetical protein
VYYSFPWPLEIVLVHSDATITMQGQGCAISLLIVDVKGMETGRICLKTKALIRFLSKIQCKQRCVKGFKPVRTKVTATFNGKAFFLITIH